MPAKYVRRVGTKRFSKPNYFHASPTNHRSIKQKKEAMFVFRPLFRFSPLRSPLSRRCDNYGNIYAVPCCGQQTAKDIGQQDERRKPFTTDTIREETQNSCTETTPKRKPNFGRVHKTPSHFREKICTIETNRAIASFRHWFHMLNPSRPGPPPQRR